MTLYTLALALTMNLLFTPYANDSHYVLLIPAWLYLVERDWRWALLYPLSWLVLLRAWSIVAEPVYAVVLLVALVLVRVRVPMKRREPVEDVG